MIHFLKYHGTGNDFVLIDDRRTRNSFDRETIRFICDRHFGIGADGLILIREHDESDFEMLYFNSDGLPGSMCGNGGRCAVAFTQSLGMINGHAQFSAFDGIHEAIVSSVDPFRIKLRMNDISEIEFGSDFVFLDTGSPHYIKFVDHVDSMNILEEGRKVRYSDRFKEEGTNVNFVEVKANSLRIRTYERGVENETLSCGTGVTASVLAASATSKQVETGCTVSTPGGILNVHFKRSENLFSDIWLEGPARQVFKGEFSINKIVD